LRAPSTHTHSYRCMIVMCVTRVSAHAPHKIQMKFTPATKIVHQPEFQKGTIR